MRRVPTVRDGESRRFAAFGRCANLPIDHTRTNRRGGSKARLRFLAVDSESAPHTESNNMKIVMVGQGAFGRKHLDGLKNIEGVEVASLVGGSKE